MTSIDDLIARLDKQAAAIRDLRKRVRALEAGATDSTGTSTSTARAALPEQYGTYVPSPDCVMCGRPKGKGRTALTCRPCSAERLRIIKSGEDRASITRSECTCCGARFKPQTRFLCADCGKGHKMWAAAQ